MRPLFFIMTLLFAFNIHAQTPKKLIVVGDSLTEGYGVAKESAFPFLLEKQINTESKTKYQVVNSGISGATTASAIGRIKWVAKQKPDVILLVLGANDGLRGLKLEESEKNLRAAVLEAQKNNIKIILGGLYMPPNYGQEYTQKFSLMYQRLSKDLKVPLVPFILEKVAGDPKYNLADGIHPNEEGHKIIAATIFKAIKGEL
ncbi:MAG: arylesterase [Bdellovibrionia bacterium]